MKGRYQIRDAEGNFGYKYTKLEHAERELAKCFPPVGQWFIFDRQEKKQVS